MIDARPLPKFTKNPTYAFEILEWISQRDYSVTIHITPAPLKYWIGVRKSVMSVDKYRVNAATLSEAVCLMLLKLKENDADLH